MGLIRILEWAWVLLVCVCGEGNFTLISLDFTPYPPFGAELSWILLGNYRVITRMYRVSSIRGDGKGIG